MKSYTLITLSLIITASFFLSGCNTVRGIGEDISGSSNFVEKKLTGEDASTPANPPQWPK